LSKKPFTEQGKEDPDLPRRGLPGDRNEGRNKAFKFGLPDSSYDDYVSQREKGGKGGAGEKSALRTKRADLLLNLKEGRAFGAMII